MTMRSESHLLNEAGRSHEQRTVHTSHIVITKVMKLKILSIFYARKSDFIAQQSLFFFGKHSVSYYQFEKS